MNKEGQQYKIIKISTKDVIDYGKKIGLKDMPHNIVNKVLNKAHKKFENRVITEKELQEEIKKQRAKVTKAYGIENDRNISNEEMLKKISSRINKNK